MPWATLIRTSSSLWPLDPGVGKDGRVARPLLDVCLLVSGDKAEGRRLVKLAERLVAGHRDAANLTGLDATLYRAGHFEEAAHTLHEAIKLQGKGGSAEDWLFLVLAEQRLGRGAQARAHLARVEDGRKGQTFRIWQQTLRWRLLHDEARRLILTMPPAAN